MPIQIPLLFHFNQHVSETAKRASYTCYRGLLRLLRANPNVPVNIHISGTLVHALKWLDPEPLQLIWEGLRAGQFELLGSTYAQNVPYASDDWDNARQIERHLEVLHETFGVTPVTFWNPERSWRQSLLPVIAAAGYRFTLIEDHILASSRIAEPVVVNSQVNAHILTMIYDDEILRSLFNFAVWFGRPGQLLNYLRERASHPHAMRHCLTYAEDAEAMGFWGWQQGIVPNQTWQRLEQLLLTLDTTPEVELIHLTNAPVSVGNIDPIPDGSGAWMDYALQHEGAPYHEDGYEDWFDFNANSPKLERYRAFFGELRGRLQAQEVAKKSPAGTKALHDAALSNYLAHQYEFGCPGVGGEGYRGWDGAQASWVLAAAADWAADPQAFSMKADVNHDEREELVLSNGKQVIVTTPAGGRLLYWFDLETGREFVGNQLAVTGAPYEGDALLPALPALDQAWWLPEEFTPMNTMAAAERVAEGAPTRMGRYLPEWIWEGERGPFSLLVHPPTVEGEHRPVPAGRRGLVDFVTLDGDEADAGAWLEDALEDGHASFTRPFAGADGVTLAKRYGLQADGVAVTYTCSNDGDNAHTMALRIVSELCPDYAVAVEAGRKGLAFIKEEERTGVRNTKTGAEIIVTCDRPGAAFDFGEGLLALEVGLSLQLELPPGAEEAFTLRLLRRQGEVTKK